MRDSPAPGAATAAISGRRIPPPPESPKVAAGGSGSQQKSAIPSPARKPQTPGKATTPSKLGTPLRTPKPAGAASSSILSTPAARRLAATPGGTPSVSKPGFLRPSPPTHDKKPASPAAQEADADCDDVRVQRDTDAHKIRPSSGGRRLVPSPDPVTGAAKAAGASPVLRSSVPSKLSPVPGSAPGAAKPPPSIISIARLGMAPGSNTAAGPAKAVPSSSIAAKPPAPGAPAPPKPLPRSVSTLKDRAVPPGETRSSILRRSCSVGKGRTGVVQPEGSDSTGQAGTRTRPTPIFARPASAAAASRPQQEERRDASAGRPRSSVPASSKDTSLLGAAKLGTIAESKARSGVGAAAAVAAPAPAKPATPSRPAFALNMAAIKQVQAQDLQEAGPSTSCFAMTPKDESAPAIPVPKLDLGGILQRRAEEQAAEPVFAVAPATEEAGSSSATSGQAAKKGSSGPRPAGTPAEDPAEHFYLYPKVNQQDKKKIDDMCRGLPKRQQGHVVDLFGKMVEARQNCEQMAFRGHRLLDQAQAEYKNRLARMEEEKEQWRQEAEFLRTQLSRMLSAQQQDLPGAQQQDLPGAQQQQEDASQQDQQAAVAALLTTFDNMMSLHLNAGPQGGGDGVGQEQGQATADGAYVEQQGSC